MIGMGIHMNHKLLVAVIFLLGIGIGWSAEQFRNSSGARNKPMAGHFSKQGLTEVAHTAAEWTETKAKELRLKVSEWLPRSADDKVKPDKNHSQSLWKPGK
jgi:hypothetical protein